MSQASKHLKWCLNKAEKVKMKKANIKKARKSQLQNMKARKSSLTKLNSNKIIPIFVAALILLLAILLIKQPILLAPGELSVERVLPTSAQLNQQFTVTLQVYTSTDKPAAIGITETFPQGWSIGNVQGADYSKINSDSLELLLFSSTNNIDDTTITYTITPTNLDATFSGTWESVDPDSSGDIAGDTSLTISGQETCGDSICQSTETCSTCASDCGTCSSPPPGGGGGGGGGGGASTTPRTCQENWLCSDWTECENEIQTRTCTDTSACGTSTTKPIEQASCNPVIKAAEQAVDYSLRRPALPISVLLIAIIIVVIVIIIIIKKRRR